MKAVLKKVGYDIDSRGYKIGDEIDFYTVKELGQMIKENTVSNTEIKMIIDDKVVGGMLYLKRSNNKKKTIKLLYEDDIENDDEVSEVINKIKLCNNIRNYFNSNHNWNINISNEELYKINELCK